MMEEEIFIFNSYPLETKEENQELNNICIL